MKKLFLIFCGIFLASCHHENSEISHKSAEKILGGDRDEHGCIGSAGFLWCEKKQKCLRPWEEKCDENSENSAAEIPKNCVSWFDGCNNCFVKNGEIRGCTRKFCAEKETPRCQKFAE